MSGWVKSWLFVKNLLDLQFVKNFKKQFGCTVGAEVVG